MLIKQVKALPPALLSHVEEHPDVEEHSEEAGLETYECSEDFAIVVWSMIENDSKSQNISMTLKCTNSAFIINTDFNKPL